MSMDLIKEYQDSNLNHLPFNNVVINLKIVQIYKISENTNAVEWIVSENKSTTSVI